MVPRRELAAADTKPTLLGAREVGFLVDRDEILVGLREGLFTIPVRHIFKEGSRSRIIDLPGRRRIIRKILFEGRALVKVYGL